MESLQGNANIPELWGNWLFNVITEMMSVILATKSLLWKYLWVIPFSNISQPNSFLVLSTLVSYLMTPYEMPTACCLQQPSLHHVPCQHKSFQQHPALCTFLFPVPSSPTPYIKVLIKQQLDITSFRTVLHFKSILNPMIETACVGLQSSKHPSLQCSQSYHKVDKGYWSQRSNPTCRIPLFRSSV